MNAYQELKRKFAAREKINGATMITMRDPAVVPAFKQRHVDFVLFDMEHGAYNTESLIPMLEKCRLHEIPSLVRVQDSQYHLIAKTIDMGADGIMLPRTDTLEQIRTAIDGIRFAPIGRKGHGGCGQFRRGETFEEFQTSRMLVCQIESPLGMQNLPEMIRRYGDQIDGFIIGPSDMSIMLGTPKVLDSEIMVKTCREFMEVCTGLNKSCGVFCGGMDDARKYRAMGANLFWTGADMGYFAAGIARIMDQLHEME